ncbi:18232_t:CDS:1, partial [Dentiscutata erythropus]
QPQNNQLQRPPNTGGSQRSQNVVNSSISTFTAVQQYNDLVEGWNPSNELQGSEILSKKTKFSSMLFLGLPELYEYDILFYDF